MKPVKDTFSRNFQDPLMRPPPGHSLTLPVGSMPYESKGGPAFTTVKDFMEYNEDLFENPETQGNILEALAAGVSVLEITNGICQASFASGKANPDVIEMSRPQIFVQIADMAEQNMPNVPYKLYPTKDGAMPMREPMDEMDAYQLASEINPEAARMYERRTDEEASRAKASIMMEKGMAQRQTAPPELDRGFIRGAPVREETE